jgi:hypothetical protein
MPDTLWSSLAGPLAHEDVIAPKVGRPQARYYLFRGAISRKREFVDYSGMTVTLFPRGLFEGFWNFGTESAVNLSDTDLKSERRVVMDEHAQVPPRRSPIFGV